VEGVVMEYQVRTRDFKAISFMGPGLLECKHYCRPGSVVVETRKVCCGFQIGFMVLPSFDKAISGGYLKNFLWLYFRAEKKYREKVVRVAWDPENP
jgi:hypothetical protein